MPTRAEKCCSPLATMRQGSPKKGLSMRIGVTFPRDGLRNDPALMRDFAQAAESLGFAHIHAGDHVIGRPGLQDSGRAIIDPFVLFAHLAAVTTTIRFFS